METSVVGITGGCLDEVWESDSSDTKHARRGDGGSDCGPPMPFCVFVRDWFVDGISSLASPSFGISAKRTLFACFNIPGGRLAENSLLELVGESKASASV